MRISVLSLPPAQGATLHGPPAMPRNLMAAEVRENLTSCPEAEQAFPKLVPRELQVLELVLGRAL